MTRFNSNFKKDLSGFSHFFSTFSIIFPAFGGIMAGSNSSGSLKRPQISIPLGSISALVLGTLFYVVTTLTLTGCHPESELINLDTSPFSRSSIFWPLVFVGIIGASLAKGTTGLGSGPMIMRAMAADNIISKIFGDYSRTIGTAFVVVLSLWGDFNNISSMSSMFFLMVFAILNIALFNAKYANAPSFRPHFTFYLPELALVSGILLFISMFIINYLTSIISMTFALILYFYTQYHHLDVCWGSLYESSAYNKGLKAALRLRHVPPSTKLYRPNVILLIDGPASQHITSIRFMDHMLHGKGMAIVARIFPTSTPLNVVVADRSANILKSGKNYHVFYETVIADTRKDALMKVMLLTGLGALRPNVVLAEFDEDLSEDSANFIFDVLTRRWSIILLRRPKEILDFGTIDVWWLSNNGGLALLIGSIIAGNSRKLRVFTVAQTDLGETNEQQVRIVKHIIRQYRIEAEVVAVSFSERTDMPMLLSESKWEDILNGETEEIGTEPLTRRYMLLADLIRTYSSHSMVVIMTLPCPRMVIGGRTYMKWLALLSSIPPPVVFIRANGTPALSTEV